MAEDKNLDIVDNKEIQNMIYTIRGKQVMVDSDLAELYKVTTGNLNKAMKRNLSRFPEHFCFQLTEEEYENLRFQNGSSSSNNNYGVRRYMSYVFTEQGIAILSNRVMFARLDRSGVKTNKKLKSKICFSMGKYMMHLALLWDLSRRLRKK